jgi:hypothetical protein
MRSGKRLQSAGVFVENAGEVAALVLNPVKAGKGADGYNAGSGE